MSQLQRDVFIIAIWILAIALVVVTTYVAIGRSPHKVLHAENTQVRLSDVVGASTTKRDLVDTLNLFLQHVTFREQMGGSARRGVLLNGPPGTGKTYIAKALAAEANMPFLSVSANQFQSMFATQTKRKVRNFFKALRRAARSNGGAIGFIDDFDAIGCARSGVGDGGAGVVFELLLQMQSFGVPAAGQRFVDNVARRVNRALPRKLALNRPIATEANVLVIAATNRATDLDPALVRPGRFDRTIHFDLPPRNDRSEISEYYLARKYKPWGY